MTAPARILEVARFAVLANLRSDLTRGGVVLGSLIMATGPLAALAQGAAWSFDGQFGFFGFLVIALFGMRSGLQEQRELGMVAFFRHNVMGPLEHALAMLASLLASWAALCAIVCGVILVLGGGDTGIAAWYSAAWGLRALLLLGFVPLVERAASFRLPLLVPALMYFVLMLVLMAVLPEGEALALFVVTPPGDLASLGRLGGQAAVMLAATSTVLLIVTAAEARTREWIDRVARILN